MTEDLILLCEGIDLEFSPFNANKEMCVCTCVENGITYTWLQIEQAKQLRDFLSAQLDAIRPSPAPPQTFVLDHPLR